MIIAFAVYNVLNTLLSWEKPGNLLLSPSFANEKLPWVFFGCWKESEGKNDFFRDYVLTLWGKANIPSSKIIFQVERLLIS